ncbi:G1/S-specific cyclin-E [Lepeophtheirus salmonis]|uniref:G1/S-specific cyclin-E n=1 Tax=Lepeophtheirus salmonis TaxID=72036 RepID=UPI001AE7DCAE|nr:G1/S-specific cyclin-E-like [Lepeophtheirus salmonis]
MRAILLDWLIEVCEVYRLHRETFYLAVDFIDRYLSITQDMPKNKLQLIGVSCLFIGAKIEEIYPPKLKEFAYVTDGACTEEQILEMELVILKALNWSLCPVTPNAWMKLFLQLKNCDKTPRNEKFVNSQFSGLPFSRIMQLIDLCTMDMGSLSFKYSVLVAAALYHFENEHVALESSGYQWKDISACVNWMSAFAFALREHSPLQPRTFHNVPVDNQHNIQTHTVELTMLDRAQERLALLMTSIDRDSPDPEDIVAPIHLGSLELTPPEEEGDVVFKPSSTNVDVSTDHSKDKEDKKSRSDDNLLSPHSEDGDDDSW